MRFYDPSLGRFLQEDPVLGSLSEPLTLNRWVYCAHDPVNRMDPSGMWFGISLEDFALGVSAALGFVPVVGEIVDVAWLVYDVAIGDWEAAAIHLACLAIPCAGAGAAKLGAKVAKNLARSGDNARDITRSIDNLGDASRSLDNVGDAGKSAGKIDDSITVRHYTSIENAKKIEKSGHLRKNSHVTLPEKIPNGASPRKVESLLELRPGRGECYIDITVKRSDLKIPFQNGGYRPYTSGDIIQFQLRNNMPIHGSTFTPTYMP